MIEELLNKDLSNRPKDICEYNACTGCMACISVCKNEAIKLCTSMNAVVARIDVDCCTQCGKCISVCPSNYPPLFEKTIYMKQGWAIDDDERKQSSSGGVASAIMKKFIENGGCVASCTFEKGEFTFLITDSVSEIAKFRGSKYVKSNMGNIYSEILNKLSQGKKTLFVGLPCQVAGVKKYCQNDENLYTIDLICHGTPISFLLEKYLSDHGIQLSSLDKIEFRDGNLFGLCCNGNIIGPKRVIDRYLLTFLYGVDYTDNCYSCRYAKRERCSDVTLGDAWGQLSDEDDNGVSLILCQTAKGMEIVEMADIKLNEVDSQKAILSNPQLNFPKQKHSKRGLFFWLIENGISFDNAAAMVIPKECFKESIKEILINLHIISDR